MSGQTTTRAPFQASIRWSNFEPGLRLVPPLADEFGPRGYEPADRMRQWAQWHRYQRAVGPPACAHDLYLMNACPTYGHHGCGDAGFDHTTVWVPADRPHEPFILTQPYASEIPQTLRDYAQAHGLEVSSRPDLGDGWHSPNALPVRLTAGSTGLVTWPLGTRAVVLTAAFPVEWPGDMNGADLWWGWPS